MLGYRDFVPRAVKGKWYEGETYESFEAALEAANAWLRQCSPKVVNIETVVLPNVHSAEETGTADGGITTMSGWATWNQFIRIWYSAR